MSIKVIVVACLLSITSSAIGRQGILIHNGFMTAQEFLDLDQKERAAYAAGFLNGILVTPLIEDGAADPVSEWANRCFVGRNNIQMGEIIRKYIADHPERWHEQLNTVGYVAINGACPK